MAELSFPGSKPISVAQALNASGLDAIDTRALLAAALDTQHARIAAHPEQLLSAEQQATFLNFIERRKRGEPVAYIVGAREFFSLEFKVTPAVLIPRPETELLVELALARIPEDAPSTVLDLGTGSGCVAIVIAKHRPHARVSAVDNSAAALALARKNAARLKAGNVEFIDSEWFGALAGRKFDAIVSNPPYVAKERRKLPMNRWLPGSHRAPGTSQRTRRHFGCARAALSCLPAR